MSRVRRQRLVEPSGQGFLFLKLIPKQNTLPWFGLTSRAITTWRGDDCWLSSGAAGESVDTPASIGMRQKITKRVDNVFFWQWPPPP